MSIGASAMLVAIGGGVLAEVLLFLLLRRLMRLDGMAAGMAVGLLATLLYVPWAILHWPGADIFAIHLAIYLTTAYALAMVAGRVGRRWHWAPASIVAFFVVVISINVVFLGVAEQGITGLFAELLPAPRGSVAVDSGFPGTVSHDYQQKETQYNAYLRQVERQQARGWQVRKGWQGRAVVRQPATFIVTVHTRSGEPLTGAEVVGEFLRSSNSRDDFRFTLSESAPGDYRASLQMPLHGVWQLVLQIRQGNELHEVRAQTTVASKPDEGRDT